jgi:DNA-directed RNA polymerase subunit M/transcription elongation factor TFIIS
MVEMAEKTVKQVCKCEHCGNEAEMVVTCSLPDEPQPVDTGSEKAPQPPKQRVKGHATCTHCGNEADMWVDLD